MPASVRRGFWGALFILLAFVLRLVALALQPLWWDEGFSVYFATESTPRLLELTSLDIHPPFYYLLLQGWYQLVGVGALQSRWLSVFLGVLAIPLVWQMVRHWLGNRNAWLTAALLVLSPFHIYYSQEVRMYGLLMLLVLGAVVAWQRRRWVWLGVMVLAGLLTQYYFALFAAALGMVILWELRHKRYRWRDPLLAFTIATVGYLPWLFYALPRLITYVGGKLVVEADTPMTPLEFLPRHLSAWSVGHLSSAMGGASGAAAIGFYLLIGLAWWAARRQPTPRAEGIGILTWLWLIPTLGIFLVGLSAPFQDIRIERQLLFVLPFFLTLVAFGVTRLNRMTLLSTLIAIVVVFGAALSDFYTVPRYAEEDYRPLLNDVAALQSLDDGWLAVYEWQIGYLRAYVPNSPIRPVAVEIEWADDPAALETGIASLLADYRRLWLPAYQVKGRIFEEQVTAALTAEGVMAWDDWYGNTRLYLFGQPPATPPTLIALGDYANIGTVQGGADTQPTVTGTGIVPVYLHAPNVTEGVRVSLQVVGRGAVWGEWDGAVSAAPIQAGIPIQAGTPPGDYEVQATLYNAADGIPLARTVDGMVAAPEASLGQVRVERTATSLEVQSLQRVATHPDALTLGTEVRWLGVALPSTPFLQGDIVPITLLWQSLQSTPREARVFIQGFGSDGTLRINHELPPVNGTFPLPQWQAGDLVRDPHRVTLPADLPSGDYTLVAGLFDPATGQRFAAANGQDTLPLGTISVTERERLMDAPTIGDPMAVRFGDAVELVQVKIEGDPTKGDAVTVQLVWRSQRTGSTPLRVFAQLYQGEQQIYSSDHPFTPPASAWIPNEYIVDTHTFPATAAGTGTYRLIVGVNDAESRQPLLTEEDAFITLQTWK